MLIALDEQENVFLREVQKNLLTIGSLFATPNIKKLKKIENKDVGKMERCIDDMTSFLPPLKVFILPGINKIDAQCHICRTITRRCEREILGYKV